MVALDVETGASTVIVCHLGNLAYKLQRPLKWDPQAGAFVGDEPLYVAARDEIAELVGAENYSRLASLLERSGWIPLPHPAVRRA